MSLPSLQVDDMCLEKRAFYRIVSGLHSSISIHLCANYPNNKVRTSIHSKLNTLTVLARGARDALFLIARKWAFGYMGHGSSQASPLGSPGIFFREIPVGLPEVLPILQPLSTAFQGPQC